MSHPFGDLLSQHLHRKHGLSQSKLAAGILQDPSIIGKMCKGQRLVGAQARERVIAIIGWLRKQGALDTVAEANALLDAAGMSGLHEREPAEAVLLPQLQKQLPKVVLRLTANAPRTNLPAPLTRFIGCEQVTVEIERLLAGHRLVTLTGAGGVGKTRQAIEVGLRFLSSANGGGFEAQYADGIWLVELAPLADPALVPQTVARVFRLPEQPGRSYLDALQDHLADKHLLLILDNCEHVIEACAEVAEKLLQRCWNVRVVATSREALRVPGEMTYLVPSLAAPSASHASNPVHDYESVRLFIDRMQPAQSAHDVSGSDVNTVAHICRQLDGIPLALELAAALTQSMMLDDIAAQLSSQLSVLTNTHRTAITRHQTMRSALAWSYNLLSSAEQTLLAWLSVFAGGWTLEAASAVCGEHANHLNSLVRKSLVISSGRDDHIRFRLLEPIRQFAYEQLIALDETDVLQSRHAAYFLALTERAEQAWDTAQEILWWERLEAERDNLRASLRWALDHRQAEFGLRMNAALFTFWNYRSDLSEASHWLHKSLAMPCDMSALGTVRARAKVFIVTGFVAVQKSGFNRDQTYMEAGLALYTKLGDKRGIAWSLRGCGFVALLGGDFDRAQNYYEQSLVICRETDDKWGLAWSLQGLGHIALAQGDLTHAQASLEDALTQLRAQGILWGTFRTLIALGNIKRAQSQPVLAKAYYREALALQQLTHFVHCTPDALEGLGGFVASSGHPARAACLFGATHALREMSASARWAYLENDYQRSLALARAQLEQEAWVAAWDEGRAMTTEQAVAYALIE